MLISIRLCNIYEFESRVDSGRGILRAHAGHRARVLPIESTLKLTFSNLDFQCKCKGPFGGAYQQTPVNLGTETCKSTDAKATGTLSVCFAGCSPGGAITSAAITEFKISDSTSVTCDSNEGFWAEVQSWLIPQFAGDIYGAVNAPIESAINGEFTTLIDDYNLDTCGSS